MCTPRVYSLYKHRTQMQTLTRTYMTVIEDFDHMTPMNENVNRMKLTHLFSNFSIKYTY